MTSKNRRLELAVATLQRKFGLRAIRKLECLATAAPASFPHISTGFHKLDEATGIGGIPRGRITEWLGAPTSGMTTVTLKIVASAQSSGDTAVYVDLGQRFDGDYAARCGVNLKRLYLVRPHSARDALDISLSLVRRRGVGVLVFDSVVEILGENFGARNLSAALRQLAGALYDSRCAVIFLTPLYLGNITSAPNCPSGFALPHYATLRLSIEKDRWIYKRKDVRGYQAQVTVFKNKLAPAGKSVLIAIKFNGTVQGDGT